MELSVRRLGPDDPDLPAVLALIQTGFAYMEGRIDPPSSMLGLTLDSLKTQAEKGFVWTIGSPPLACAIGTLQPEALYLGKITVAETARGQGLSRRLVDHAAACAEAENRRYLELQSRVELTEVHAAFAAMGFAEVGRTAHAGYDRPTSITFRRPLV